MKLVKLLIKLIMALLVFIGVTFTIYWFNADMKLIRFVYDKLQPHYDKMKKDRKF